MPDWSAFAVRGVARFSELRRGQLFISPEGSFCEKASDWTAIMREAGGDSAYANGELMPFKPWEEIGLPSDQEIRDQAATKGE